MLLKIYLNKDKNNIVKYELLTNKYLSELDAMEQITLSEIGTLEEDAYRPYEIIDTSFVNKSFLDYYSKLFTMITPLIKSEHLVFN